METKNKKDYDSLMLSNLRNSEKYRIEKMRADANFKKYHNQLEKNNEIIKMYFVWVIIAIASLLTNLYFIFK